MLKIIQCRFKNPKWYALQWNGTGEGKDVAAILMLLCGEKAAWSERDGDLCLTTPLNIYTLHPGDWLVVDSQEQARVYDDAIFAAFFERIDDEPAGEEKQA